MAKDAPPPAKKPLVETKQPPAGQKSSSSAKPPSPPQKASASTKPECDAEKPSVAKKPQKSSGATKPPGSFAGKLQNPVNVSPFIRFWRWGALIAGIVYGATHKAALRAQKSDHDKKTGARDEELLKLQKEAEDDAKACGVRSYADVRG